MANNDIRNMAKAKGVFLWEIANKWGINDGNFSRKMRVEFTKEEKARAMKYIQEIYLEKSRYC